MIFPDLVMYSARELATVDVCHWHHGTILTTLFSSTQGYIVSPQRRLPDDPEGHIIIEVVGKGQ